MVLKVGIMSMQRIANYGSYLQAYALKNMIEELGHSVQFVDYRVGRPLVAEGNNCLGRLGKVVEVLKYDASLRQRLQFLVYKKQFSEKFFPYLSIKIDPNYTPELDTLMIGSDEVFNCTQSNLNVGFSPELFGKDARAKRLISYAASFGNTTIEKLNYHNKADEIGLLLARFDAISVRDKNSAEIVEALINIRPKQHVDPVLAYDFKRDYNIRYLSSGNKKYILLYSYSGRINRAENIAIREYAVTKGLKIYSIGGIHRCADKFIDCSPFEVFSYFKNAEAVITDTFHGTIFSIINECPFVTLIRKSKDNTYGNEEKLSDLLEKVGLRERIINSIEDIGTLLGRDIDWISVGKTLDSLRAQSCDYLSKECTLSYE